MQWITPFGILIKTIKFFLDTYDFFHFLFKVKFTMVIANICQIIFDRAFLYLFILLICIQLQPENRYNTDPRGCVCYTGKSSQRSCVPCIRYSKAIQIESDLRSIVIVPMRAVDNTF